MSEQQALTERAKKIKATQKNLGEPFGLEFSEPVRKMRTHLLMAVAVSIFAVVFELKIKPDVPVFGVPFEGLTEKKILSGLVAINVYLLLHFLWCSIDVFNEWRLRRTGTMTAYVETADNFFGDEALDFSDDPRQSTLYGWWSRKSVRMIALPQTIAAIDQKIATMMEAVMVELNKAQTPELVRWQTTFSSLSQQLSAVAEALKDEKKILESERIPASLQRFDDSFRALRTSQNVRWLFLEWLFPLLLGVVAISLLAQKIYIAV